MTFVDGLLIVATAPQKTRKRYNRVVSQLPNSFQDEILAPERIAKLLQGVE